MRQPERSPPELCNLCTTCDESQVHCYEQLTIGDKKRYSKFGRTQLQSIQICIVDLHGLGNETTNFGVVRFFFWVFYPSRAAVVTVASSDHDLGVTTQAIAWYPP